MRKSVLTAFAALLLFPGSVLAGWIGFLRLDGVPGDSLDASHVGWIDISAATSANFIRTPDPLSAHPAGTLAPDQPLVLTKILDVASPELALMCAKGQMIPTGTLDLISNNTNTAVPALRLELKNIYLTSVNQSSGSPRPVEQVQLLSELTQWCYAKFNTNSGLPGYQVTAWDFPGIGGSATTQSPNTITTGIRVASGVQLSWNAISGKSYCIFAVPRLGAPFSPLISQTATSTGTMTFTMSTANNNVLFYVVDQLP